jgi:GDP-4-dehydro-6-deoxy-D-mannose reductase
VIVPRALVTGAAGFVGRWLVASLAEQGYEVTGLATERPADDGTLAGRGGLPTFPRDMHWQIGDLRDTAHVHAAINTARPHVIIHLAAISHLPTAQADPALAWDVNVTSTARLLREVVLLRDAGEVDPCVLIVGSAEQYGRHDASPLLDEASAQLPRTVYAATKCAQEVLALQQWRATGLRAIVTRSFNHSGPGQETRFLLPALVARALALRGTAGRPQLLLGNLSPVRDFLHVRDVVRAYISLCERGTPGEAYNVSSGIGRSVRQVAESILERVGVSAELVEDPALVRPVDVPSLVGDSRKLQRAIEWRATTSFDDLIDDLLNAATY